jgi:hypothetical protein
VSRIHALELHEQTWCPAAIRDAATDYLQFVTTISNPYAPIVERLRKALAAAGTREVLDLCSGGGGPWFGLQPVLSEELGAPVRVKLSDFHPNEGAFARAKLESDSNIDFVPESVSVLDVPKELAGFRTMFAALHHFRPDAARAIIADAVAERRGIAVFEPLGRSVPALLSVVFAPLAVLVLTPFIRPFRWSRLLLTYLVPIVPLVVLFDGVVSCLRTYTPDELRDLVAGIDAPGYHWEIGDEAIPRTPASLTYLIGYPKPS